jgi:hypothetical protein
MTKTWPNCADSIRRRAAGSESAVARNQPTPEYLEALARRALALNHQWMADATPIQHMVAMGGSHYLTIERAAEWPFTSDPYIICLTNWIMNEVLRHGRDLREAVQAVPRSTR